MVVHAVRETDDLRQATEMFPEHDGSRKLLIGHVVKTAAHREKSRGIWDVRKMGINQIEDLLMFETHHRPGRGLLVVAHHNRALGEGQKRHSTHVNLARLIDNNHVERSIDFGPETTESTRRRHDPHWDRVLRIVQRLTNLFEPDGSVLSTCLAVLLDGCDIASQCLPLAIPEVVN